MSPTNLKSFIQQAAKEEGFAACGCAKARFLKEPYLRYTKALQEGYFATMHWLEREPRRRFDPALVMPGIHTVIVVLGDYHHGFKQKNGAFYKISKYAVTEDYHDTMLARLRALVRKIDEAFPGYNFKVYTDTGPVAEKAWAVEAGLGVYGKNTLLLTEKGSWYFIGIILTDAKIEPDNTLNTDLCAECNLCLHACPTGALVEPFRLDARKCVSYQTIENKGEIDPEVAPKLGTRLYGCDTCQDVCPYNRRESPRPVFFKPAPVLDLSKEDFESLDEEGFSKIFKGTAVKRIKFTRYQRNLTAIRSRKRPPLNPDGPSMSCKTKSQD
ncbi:MAG: tRNA epoxyqueuosine(34) reductase QueG [Bacteroidales bacterium]|jgi:epoxyqueuosine reductase|nr:tRNA epoxyqueuosine(34) reductase QueG [Bacteroidales bacterium]NPV35618.1 tRNA epoxyqueuosine(34) reductase QueG [Bacteroidales bacterium]